MTRTALIIIGACLFVMAGIGLLSAFFMIGFGGFFQRMEGWEVVTGSIIAIGIGVTCVRYKPKFGVGVQQEPTQIDLPNDESESMR